jgi:hypothetical protein
LLFQTNCAKADIDRTLAQSIIDKRLALEDSHYSQRLHRLQQLLDISEARVRELVDENKSLVQQLAAAELRRSSIEEELTSQQLALQRVTDEVSDIRSRLSEARNAASIEVATANARHAREILEQQQAAVQSARSFKLLLQQRDAKIADLSRIVTVLAPPKVSPNLPNLLFFEWPTTRCSYFILLQPQDFLMSDGRSTVPCRPQSLPTMTQSPTYSHQLSPPGRSQSQAKQ